MKNFIILIICFSAFKCNGQTNNTIIKDPYEKAEIIGGIDSLKKEIKNITILENCNIGKVYIQVSIDENGNFTSSEIAKGLCHKADSIAKDIVKRIKYKPARKNGEPYKSNLIIPIEFTKK